MITTLSGGPPGGRCNVYRFAGQPVSLRLAAVISSPPVHRWSPHATAGRPPTPTWPPLLVAAATSAPALECYTVRHAIDYRCSVTRLQAI